MLRALFYAYVLGGLTFLPLVIFLALFITVYTSVPVGDPDVTKKAKRRLEANSTRDGKELEGDKETTELTTATEATNDMPRTRKGWLTVRRTFEEAASDSSYVTLVRSFLDSRSKDPKRSRPKDMWYVVLKGTVLYLYEDEEMSECEAAIELSRYQVIISPEDLPDAELFAKRNAVYLRPKASKRGHMPNVTKEMRLNAEAMDDATDATLRSGILDEHEREQYLDENKKAREQALDPTTPWFIFVRSNIEMEEWYFALIHASEQPAQTPTLLPLRAVFNPADMDHLVSTLDGQPDVIPMRWLNAILGRIFFSHYRTQAMESYIVGRLMKKLAKVKRPSFLTEVTVTEVSVGSAAPMFSKPMLKELTKEGDASIEVHLQYKGEVRITVEATAVINLGARFKSYTVKLVLAAVLKELEGNLLIKVKRPPSNRIWYAFTQTPRMIMEVEPIVSDRQITWGMILSTIESKFKEIIQESVVMPNMDDIAFFDTESLEHRGGIWSEACRKSQAPTTVSEVGVQADSSASTPVVMTVSSDSTSSASAQRVDDDPSIQSAPPASNILFEILPSPSTNPDDSPDSWHNTTSRRSWFSSTRSDDMAGASIPTPFTDDHRGDTPEEGRDCPSESDKSTVANFQPPKDYPDLRSTTLDTAVTIDEQESLQMSSSRPPSSRRSASQHSVKVKTQSDSVDQESVNPQNTSAPSTPRKVSDASEKVALPSSPPSFFSTLKSKTADKQAIKETAKEAIRKWGVNWGGSRKDGSNTDNIPASDTSRPGVLHAEGSAKALAHRPRASYAEVRAAVAERKEREKISQPLESGSESTAQHLPSQPETSSVPLSPNTLTTNPETSVDSAPASRLLTPSGLPQKKSSPSISRINTETEAQQNLQPLLSEEPIKQTPIHVQPIAKTMSIPGIHASHRGEVQSMGYVAPQPQPPQVPVKEAMLKNPAIQTVYRFLKSSNNGDRNKHETSEAQNQGDQQDNSPLSSAQTILKTSDNHSESTTSMPILQSYDHDTSKSLPPPLPPRSQATLPSSRIQEPLSFSPPLSASGDLKNIVEKDERSRPRITDPDVSTSASSGVHSPQEWQPDDDNCEQAASRIQSTDIHDLFSDSLQTDLYSSDALSPKSSANIGKPPPLPPRRSKTPTSDSTVKSS